MSGPHARSQDRPPRVLVVNLGRFGGVTEYGWSMARALSRRCDIAVMYSSAAENRHKWSELDVPLLEVETFSSVPGMLAAMLSPARFTQLRRFARAFDPDVIYYPGGHAFKPVLDVVLPRRAKIVLTVHDPQLHHGEDSLSDRLLTEVNRLRVDGYVLLNEIQRAEYIARHDLDPARVLTIPLGIFEDLALPGPAPEPTARQGLLFVGRIRPYKGLGVLLDAYRTAAIDPVTPLLIAGQGQLSAEETASLERLQAEGRPVSVINRWLQPDEIPPLVATSRFVVLPYTSATQSGVVPFASALGVPAIAAAAGGITEQVIDGTTGLLFAPGDAEALASVLARALALDAGAYAAMSEACERHAKEHWDWDLLSGKLLEFIEGL